MQATPVRAVERAVPGVLAAIFAWDLAAWWVITPEWWSATSYTAIAAVVGISCLVLLMRFFARRRGDPRPHGALVQLVAIGLLLGAWLLRAHPEIPPDAPLVAATLVAALIYAAPLITRRSYSR